MPRNASGVYTLPAGNPVVPGTTIEASWANSTMEDMANEITNSLSRTGAGGMLAPFRIADGIVTAPGLAFTNETNTGLYRSGTGTAALVVTGVPVIQMTASAVTIPAGKVLNAQGGLAVTGTLGATGAVTLSSTLAVSGAITASGGVSGNVTGNVTAASGSSSFYNVSVTNGLNMGSALISALGTPVADTDAATKGYVDSVAQGIDAKASCLVATTANITLSGTQTIDGVAVTAGKRVLVKDQTNQAENGIYVCAAGAWSRASDANTWDELVSAFTFIEQGTANDNAGFVCTISAGGTLGVTAVTWTQFSGAGNITAGDGMVKVGNTLNVQTASSARIVVRADDIDLATSGITAGTYKSLTIDQWGRATTGTNPTTLAGYGITDAYTTTYIDTLFGSTASAAASASAAAASAAAAASSYDSFDDRYLGAKASDPSVDNDGNALITGALYFNTTIPQMRVYTGSTWTAAVGGSGTVTSVALSGGTTGLTVTGSPITTSGTITLSGTLAVANGGTGQTTAQAAINALAGAATNGQFLRGNGTNVVMSAIQAADVPTLNQNTTGTAANVTGTVAIANGGTGLTALGTASQILRVNSGGTALEYATLTGGGDVVGPASANANSVPVFSSSTGKALGNSQLFVGVLQNPDFGYYNGEFWVYKGLTAYGPMLIDNGDTGQAALRLKSPDGAFGYVALKAANTATNFTFILPASYGTNGQVLTTNGSGALSWSSAGGGAGTVTSVGLTMPTGFSVTGSPVTSSGTLAVTTSLNGILKGNGSGFTTATASTDYAPATTGTNAQLLANSGSGGFANVTVGSGLTLSSGTLTASGGGLAWQSVQTTGFTAVAGRAYPCNTTSAAFTVTLPASATAGDQITLTDYAGTFGTNNLTVNPNGLKIQGDTANKIISTSNNSVSLVYIDSTRGWLVDGAVTASPFIPPPSTVEYLVVAGGAAGGSNHGGGGGAGGFRTGTGLTVTAGNNYTITVGAGGAGSAAPSIGGVGGNSSIAGSPITESPSGAGANTLKAYGGGGGSGYTQGNGANGGSGGGAAAPFSGGPSTGGTGNTPNASSGAPSPYNANQGTNGGNGGPASGNYGAGGGGGANTAGTAGGSVNGGAGGDGTPSSITGSAVTYGGGGGGGSLGGSGGAGGSGGGGAGTTSSTGGAGTANRGGGGGGNGTLGSGGNGGSGIVIIAYPDTFASLASVAAGLTCNGSAGNKTPDTSSRPGYKVYTFTNGTGTISW